MNVSMWIKALRIIPRVDNQEWKSLDVISKWLISTRSAVLIMTFISSMIAGLFAYRSGQFDLLLWLLVTIGLVMAHATNNMLNDYIDSKKGVDKDNYFRSQYGPQVIEHDLMTKKEFFYYVIITGLIALFAGSYLVYLRGTLALILLLAGAFFVLFYTFPLKYIGLGELAVLIVWGPLMIGGGYFVITGHWDWYVVLGSLPYAIGTTTVLFGKHIDKFSSDKDKNINTFPVIIGEKSARYTVLGMIIFQYLLVFYLVLIGFFSPVVLIVILAAYTFKDLLPMYSKPRPNFMPEGYREDVWPSYFVAIAFLHNRRFGLLFLIGLIADVIIVRFF